MNFNITECTLTFQCDIKTLSVYVIYFKSSRKYVPNNKIFSIRSENNHERVTNLAYLNN